ncbi:DUF3800 domain-containing protein [soil metagenome]
MMLAYIDEIGETGAFVAKDDPRYNTSPAFGYAGFVIPAENARAFGSDFTHEKRALFATELKGCDNPGQWERKGSEIFRPQSDKRFPQQIRVFNGLVQRVVALGGRVFFYADEKPIGTPKQTSLDAELRETVAMRETLNRLCRYAEARKQNLMVLIDHINESQRAKRLPNMYGHILGRAATRHEMLRIIEPPTHVDSELSANIQFADWLAASLTRAIEFQLIADSPYGWIASNLGSLRGSFTFESKIHLFGRSIGDLTGPALLGGNRPLFTAVRGQRVSNSVDPRVLRRIYGAAQKHQPAGENKSLERARQRRDIGDERTRKHPGGGRRCRRSRRIG